MFKKLSYLLPLLFLLFLVGYLFISLDHHRQSGFHSKLMNQPMPNFSLPRVLDKGALLTQEDLKGRLSLVNFFSSTCRYCLMEHEGLMELSRSGKLDLYGIHLRKTPEMVTRWLEKHGNPYKAVGMDYDIATAVSWGVTSTPETFIMSPEGLVILHHRGPLSPEAVMEKIIPLIEEQGKTQEKAPEE